MPRDVLTWNDWRKKNPDPQIHRPHWYDSPGAGGRQVKGRNRLDFSQADLSCLTIYGAFAEGLNLNGSTITDCIFEEGDFSRADFNGATFRNTRFNKTILTGASFDGATFVNCNLNRVNLVGASFCVNEITETVVYGISAWDLKTCEEMKQSKLVIEKTYDFYSNLVAEGKVPLMVDDIELAEFIYYLTNHKKLRNVLNVANQRGVLLLGGFLDGGLDRLNDIRERLSKLGYMPMIFDWGRPDSLSKTETALTMAGLCKFVIADLSGPSVPYELRSIFTAMKKPLLAIGKPFALFDDVEDLTAVVQIDHHSKIEAKLGQMEEMHRKRIYALALRDLRAARIEGEFTAAEPGST